MKVLILKPSSLGDVVHAIPVLRLLKKRYPQSQVYWWLEKRLLPLLEGDPDLTGVIPFDRAGWNHGRGWRELWGCVRWARRQRFDWVIDLQSLARSAWLAWWTNGARTVGLEDWREGAPAFYDHAVPRPSYGTHAVDWYLGVLPFLEVPVSRNFEWLPPRPDVAEAIRQKWPVEAVPWVLLQPGGRWQNKRWPAEYFAEVVGQLSRRFGRVRFAVLGSESEAGLGEVICRVCPDRCVNLAGRLSLWEMIEWIRLGALLLSNDSGPMHVAAALDKPMVALFGPTEPRRTGPYGRLGEVIQGRLPCIPCLKDTCRWSKPLECLRSILPEVVTARASRVLEGLGAEPAAGERS